MTLSSNVSNNFEHRLTVVAVLGVVLATVGTGLFAAGVLSVPISLLSAFSAVADEAPAQRAQLLAESISEAMNLGANLVVAAIASWILAVTCAVGAIGGVSRRRRASASSGGRDSLIE